MEGNCSACQVCYMQAVLPSHLKFGLASRQYTQRTASMLVQAACYHVPRHRWGCLPAVCAATASAGTACSYALKLPCSMPCQLDLVCLAEQQKGQTIQQPAQSPSCKQPMAQYAFNPDARSFVPSKIFQRVNVQTLKSDSGFRALNTCSKASQAASPDSHKAALQPASPRIAAKMATPTSQKSSSTQEASVTPKSTQPAAVGTATEAGSPTISDSTTPGSESHSVQDSMANCAKDSQLTDGREQHQKRIAHLACLNSMLACACAAAVRTDEEASCTGREAGQDEQQLDSKLRRGQVLYGTHASQCWAPRVKTRRNFFSPRACMQHRFWSILSHYAEVACRNVFVVFLSKNRHAFGSSLLSLLLYCR